MNRSQQQTAQIVMITFWSQFSSYALNSILILFLTRPLITHGLGYSEAKSYAFMGITNATGYLMPILGGFIADRVLGLRRSIFLGGLILALVYLLVMLSGYTIPYYGDGLFVAAYALIPAASSLLMGNASGLIASIYTDEAIQAKTAMTYYYMAINLGALLAIIIAPSLLNSQYGPLSVLALTFIGKSIAAMNFAYRYALYDDIVIGYDKKLLSWRARFILVGYLVGIYLFTLLAYFYINLFSVVISCGCFIGIGWFLAKTFQLSGSARTKQLVACLLIFEAIIFFVIYNQMNSTLILFAQKNSDHQFLNFSISAAQYQILNPLLILILGLQLPRFYQKFPRFTIPYQFASGTLIAGIALFLVSMTAYHAQDGIISGNMIALTYLLISLAELCVSAIGLSMIGLYCDRKALGFAMGAWYLAGSLSNIFSGQIAHFVAIPKDLSSPLQSIVIYQQYYLYMGLTTIVLGMFMFFIAWLLHKKLNLQGLSLV
jgi:POT family proton-dependent oligopeptide transporter